MSELKQGDKAWVSNLSEDDAINMKMERVFVVNYGCVNYCDRYAGIGLFAWKFAVKIPEPKTIPFTAKTFPKGMVWVRDIKSEGLARQLVVSITLNGFKDQDGWHSWFNLLEGQEISLDGGETWQVAGIEENV